MSRWASEWYNEREYGCLSDCKEGRKSEREWAWESVRKWERDCERMWEIDSVRLSTSTVVRCTALLCFALLCTVQYTTLHYSTVHYSTTQRKSVNSIWITHLKIPLLWPRYFHRRGFECVLMSQDVHPGHDWSLSGESESEREREWEGDINRVQRGERYDGKRGSNRGREKERILNFD